MASSLAPGVLARLAFVLVVLTATAALAAWSSPPAGTSSEPWGSPEPYLLPRSAFNITDHNLTYADNGFFLRSVVNGSFDATLEDTLHATGALPADLSEAQVGIGPVPAGPDESNITPLLIVQFSGSGLLRIEYIPFPMNDTYGYLAVDRVLVPSGSAPFSGHVLELRYVATAPGVPPYVPSRPYGETTGNLTVLWDGIPLTSHFPMAWSSFGAFYAYGLKTGAFDRGAVFANVSSAPVGPAPVGTLLGAPSGVGLPAENAARFGK